jgi:hypothetical protein
MAGHKEGRGQATKDEGGFFKALDRAWDDAKSNGAGSDDWLTVQQIQVQGNNPIHTYVVIIGP